MCATFYKVKWRYFNNIFCWLKCTMIYCHLSSVDGNFKKWTMIEASLAITSCDKLYFVSFHTDNIDEDAYKFQMLRLNRDLGLQTKVVNHQAWANMCFFQFLYLTIVNCSSEIVDFFWQEALEIYSFHNNSHRKIFLVPSLAQTFKLKTCQEEPKIEPHCTIQWIIRNAPNVKKLIRLGISSAEWFDTWALIYNWSKMN